MVVLFGMSKKSFLSAGRSLWKRFNKMFGHHSAQVMAIFLMLVMIFLISGGVHALSALADPRLVFESPNMELVRGIMVRTVSIMLIYLLGAAGLLLIYWSIKYRHNPGQASLLVKIGAVILVIAFVILEFSPR